MKTGRQSEKVENRRRHGSFKVFPVLLLACLIPGWSQAQIGDIVDIINMAVRKVIVATDLTIERMQTETIDAQAAEKAEENDMQQSELDGIASWVEQQRDLFTEYYQELRQVKNVIASYGAIAGMIEKQGKILMGCRQVYASIRQGKHFSVDEVGHASLVLAGIAAEGARNIERMTLVVTSMLTQMSDAGRMQLIDETGAAIEKNYSDLGQLSQQYFLLSLQRARDAEDIAVAKALYGIH